MDFSKLPCLPGFNFDGKFEKNRYNKSHFFDKIHEGVFYLSEKVSSSRNRYKSVLQEENSVPTWLAFDGQKLIFDAYLEEISDERYQVQIRSVFIFFYLEDGTVKISEPRTSNSGLEQGVLVGRQKILKPGTTSQFYDVIDFNIGKQVTIYGRVYKIINCDTFTRTFLHRMGIPVPDAISSPLQNSNETQSTANIPDQNASKASKLENFLKNDRRILRYYGFWDDRDSFHGSVHDVEIRYYLSDGTMDVKGSSIFDCIRKNGVVFAKKTKIPKFFSKIEPIGAREPFTILNVLGENIENTKSYYIVDPLKTADECLDHYKDNDLYIGAKINVFGREIVIKDMDESTREYYRTRYGIEDFTPIKSPNEKNRQQNIEKLIPPYNGYGSYEDSLKNCVSIVPKNQSRAKNPKFFYCHHKESCQSLRFKAKMISHIPENNDRQFVISFFLIDDTISIYEVSGKNSGFKQCLFQKPMKVLLPGQNLLTNKKPQHFQAQDFYVGALLNNLNGHQFFITSADLFTLRYMENNSSKFPKANDRLIMEKLRENLATIYEQFIKDCSPLTPKNGNLTLEYRKFKGALCKLLGEKISEHEIITIARRYAYQQDAKGNFSRESIRAIVHTELNKQLWDKLERLEENLDHIDRTKTGYLSKQELYSILRGSRIPIYSGLLNLMLDQLHKNDEGKISYRDLLQFLDVKNSPLEPVPPINVKASSEKEPDCNKSCTYADIDWDAFSKDLALTCQKATF